MNDLSRWSAVASVHRVAPSDPPPLPDALTGISFRVLGPLEVTGEAGSVEITAPRQQIVLAMLLLADGQVVPTANLAEAVWGDRPPRTARSQVQICISTIRQTLAEVGLDDRLRTRPRGYQLSVAATESDLRAFSTAVDEGHAALRRGDPTTASRVLRAALSLWRGEPFLELDRSTVLQSVAAGLVESRLTTIEARIDADLELGMHHEVIPELQGLVIQHPLREQLRGQLMLALYRAGRQSEALGEYQAVRHVLIDEFGLEPGAALSNLEHNILSSADCLAAAPPTVAPAPEPVRVEAAPDGAFVGRADLVADLHRRLDFNVPSADPRSAPTAIVVSGLGGAGKSTLARNLAQLVLPRYPDGCLWFDLGRPGADAPDLAQVFRELLQSMGVPDFAVPSETGALAQAYRERCAGRRMLVVIDNVPDEDTARELLPSGGSNAAIVCSRTRLPGLESVHAVELGPLGCDDATEYLHALLARAGRTAAASELEPLVDCCGAMPLALEIVGRLLGDEPSVSPAELAEHLADTKRRLDVLVHEELNMRAALRDGHETLSRPAQVLLRRLTLLDEPVFAAWAADPLVGPEFEPVVSRRCLQELIDAHLVIAEHILGVGTRFHMPVLVRVFAAEMLAIEDTPVERMEALQRTLACRLEIAHSVHLA